MAHLRSRKRVSAARRRGERWIQRALGVKRRRRGLGPHHRKSVRIEAAHKGLLHRRYGISVRQKIPTSVLLEDRAHLRRKLRRTMGREHEETRKWLMRVNFAIVARKFKKNRRRK